MQLFANVGVFDCSSRMSASSLLLAMLFPWRKNEGNPDFKVFKTQDIVRTTKIFWFGVSAPVPNVGLLSCWMAWPDRLAFWMVALMV